LIFDCLGKSDIVRERAVPR